MSKLPDLVVHADWSVDARRRWRCRAILGDDGRYKVLMPEPVGILKNYFADLSNFARDGAILAGFDFPIGLPKAYAHKIGVSDFIKILPRLGSGSWSEFYEVAETQQDIKLRRPFYPARRGSSDRNQLVRGLGLDCYSDLMRRCEGATENRPAANSLFWTLGAKQVGKGTIIGWRDTIAPALRDGRYNIDVWPFSSPFRLRNGQILVVEAYPAEFYGHLGLRGGARWSKRKQASRISKANAIILWANQAGIGLTRELRDAVKNGFGSTKDGEDRFDATIGTLGQLGVVLGHCVPGNPPDRSVSRIEGWILGYVES